MARTINKMDNGNLHVVNEKGLIAAYAEISGVYRRIFDTETKRFNPQAALMLLEPDGTPVSPTTMQALKKAGFPWSGPFSQKEAELLLSLWVEFQHGLRPAGENVLHAA